MRHARAALARVAGVFIGHRDDNDLREELESHLEMETAEYIRRGMEPAEARRQALLASGGLGAAAEAVRAQRGLPWLECLASDIEYALRALRRNPAFTAVVVMTLALGVGANTAIVSVVHGVLLKPLPHRGGDRLVYLRQSRDAPGGANITFSVPELNDLRREATSLAGIATYSPFPFSLQADTNAFRINVGLVNGDFFDVMGLSPVLGRLIRPSDDRIGAAAVMVLTHDAWMKRFQGDSGIVGTQVTLNGRLVRVIGVVQPAPYYPDRLDALANVVVSAHHTSAFMVQGRTHRMTEIIARLAPGATVEQARREVTAIHARLERDFPDAYDPGSNFRVAVIPYKEALSDGARLTVWLLMGAAALVLVISTASVVNLTLMRGVRREHELVVRAALGAGVRRLRRLLLAENLVLALIGGLFGVILAIAGVGLLVSLAARYSPRAGEVRLDVIGLAFALALSVAIALLLSVVAPLPKEGTFASWISAGGRRMSGSLRKQRLQRGLVVAQIAVSVMLLAGAGLLTRTMMQLSGANTGLRSENVLTMQVELLTFAQLDAASAVPADIAAADAGAKVLYDRMRHELARLPGVVDVGIGSNMPLRSSTVQLDIKTEDGAAAVDAAMPRADFRTASADYFRVAGIPVLMGRPFSTTDTARGERVVIINQELAGTLFPNVSPIGKRMAWTGDVLRFTPLTREWRRIVGVVGNTRDGGMDATPRPAVFMPFAQELVMGAGFVIRADDASDVAASATRIVKRIAPAALIENVMTVAQIKDQSVAPRRLNAVLVSLFGILAVSIAAVGIAGVLGFSVSARTNEIGIRMSLGADGGRVLRLILAEGGALLAMGLALGTAAALLASGVIRGLLFGVGPRDPITFAGVVVVMAVVGLVACWIPARRAARIDPAIAMRAQ